MSNPNSHSTMWVEIECKDDMVVRADILDRIRDIPVVVWARSSRYPSEEDKALNQIVAETCRASVQAAAEAIAMKLLKSLQKEGAT